jgi:NDP-sugar pyrophosphorylase family protein/aminoglycoside/choline kinase family phosphotransferase
MSKYPVTIFLPAAGLGERLRPVTNHLPKPLLPLLGRPIIQRILEGLAPLCSGGIGINLHWKADLIRHWAAGTPWKDRITFFPEDPILGTGGALKNASSLLSNGPFIVHNSDILLDIDFTRLIEEHLSSGNLATLVCHRLPRLSNVVIDRNGQLLDVENPGESKPDPANVADKVAYTGIAIYDPAILDFLPAGVSHATVAWIAASKAGHKVRAMDFTGSYWNDVGNPVTYTRGVLDALRESGETVYISPTAQCREIEIDGYVVLEAKAEVRPGSRLRNCIVMPGAVVTGRRDDRILGPDFEIALTEADMQPSLHAAEKKRVELGDALFSAHFGLTADASPPDQPLWSDAVMIGLGGSDRRYFRVRNGGKTAVLMECRQDDPDYERHIVYTRFFEAHAVPVPGVLATDDKGRRALFEDLGDTSLYSYLKLPHHSEHIDDVYRSVLDILVLLHSRVTRHISECTLLRERLFDYEHLRWETSYFLQRFIVALRGISLQNRNVLENEFHRIAERVDGAPKGVIHRDFQSQNIMVPSGGIPRVIDFQGARMAPGAYDVASILWDPYYRIEDGLRERLVGYYEEEMGKAEPGFDVKQFRNVLLLCRLQRHMQALGAYGFLSVVKGKRYFLKHVPEALRLLQAEAEEAKADYPELHRLVKDLK